MTRDVYATNKLAWHPDVLDKLRRAKPTVPILVQIMPENRCSAHCAFCSYGHWVPDEDNPDPAKWKNNEQFVERDSLPLEKMRETVACMAELGVKAVEITGGGEPTMYKYFDELVRRCGEAGLEVSLVTNGINMPEARGDLLAAVPFSWARVSIDAGNVADYCRTRHVPVTHWERAWQAVRVLAARKRHPECAVGVGFVIDRDNHGGVYDGCRLAKQRGADNIRISMSFTPDGQSRWAGNVLEVVAEQVARAKAELEDDTFRVNDLSAERAHNVKLGWQEYPLCVWAQVGCVIGADQNLYSCCSFAYAKAGLIGSIRERTFTQVWTEEGAAWREKHDPRRDCYIHCLYEGRNKEGTRLLIDREHAATVATGDPPPHRNFV